MYIVFKDIDEFMIMIDFLIRSSIPYTKLVIEKESEKISKLSKKIILKSCNFDQIDYSSCPVDDQTVNCYNYMAPQRT